MASIKACCYVNLTVVTVLLIVLSSATNAQLSFHNDPSQNSFSIKLPAFQQSFTRYFGNQPQGALLQQQLQQPQQLQQQIPSTLTHPSLIGSQAQAYQQQQQQPLYYSQQPQQQSQSDALNRYVAQFPDQPHYTVQENYINPNIRLRLQQQRLQQQQQQQQYHPSQANQYQGFTGSFGTPAQTVPTAQDASAYTNQQQQPQYEYVQQTTGAEGQQELLAQPQYQPATGQFGVRGTQQQQTGNEGEAATAAKLIGVAFSPSNEVSQVKFSSGGLKYNF
ncbi:putative mediator of RNA polymerase II transcription subunit 26 [Anopheles maculipalpis]|uniref:putative mediator of RNA polymerase II transcription subunit 26 n=1 Tax=Anopheles maculipalpis TaxID=1496333 RepID=UPI00215956AF|nr:putative mediator of RNA polymerase II transcription subunit 26 [Anopheles maculipalpis]